MANPYVNEHGWPTPHTAKERRRLAELDTQRPRYRRPLPPTNALAVQPGEQHECFQCHQKTVGRFTNKRTWSGQGWSQHMQTPIWACFACLPWGDGRDEDGAQP